MNSLGLDYLQRKGTMSLTLRSGLAFAVFCASGLCPQASVFPQQESGGAIETQPAVLTVPGSPADFEVKRVPGKGLMVRRKGTLEWTPNSKFSEPIAVGALDADHKIYLVPSKAIRPPKGRISTRPNLSRQRKKVGKGRPSIFAFCCGRSRGGALPHG